MFVTALIGCSHKCQATVETWQRSRSLRGSTTLEVKVHWIIIENIVLYVLAGSCFYLLPDWWKLLGLSFLLVVNLYSKRDAAKGK